MICAGTQSAKKQSVSQTYLTAGVRWPAYFLAGIFRKSIVVGTLSVSAFIIASTSFAATVPPTMTIGPEAAVPLPSSALWKGIIGDQPSDDEVQNYNPPVFKWIYMENGTKGTLQTDVRTFQFQLSTNADFSSLYWNIACSNNFYNFLPPITNSDGTAYLGTNYWRIVYQAADGTTVVGTGPVHRFTISPTAVTWDRSMLADTNYLLGIATAHPHMWFNPANVGAMASFLKNNSWPTYGRSFSSTTNDAGYYQKQTWWANSGITNIPNTQLWKAVTAAQSVAFAYYMTGSNAMWDINGAAQTLDWFATAFRQQGDDLRDPYLVDTGTENTFATAYDWLYPFMSPMQRSNVLYTMESIASYCAFSDYWGYMSQPAVTNRIFTNKLQTIYFSSMKIASSHERYCAPVGLEFAIAGMAESPRLLSLFPMFMNYSLAQFDPYQGDEGRGYAEQDNFKYDREFGAAALSTVIFPEAKLWVNPVFTNLAAFFANWEPVGFRAAMDPWGDLGYDFKSQWFHTRYYDLALITQSGAVLRQFNRSSAFRTIGPDVFPLLGEAFLPFYFPKPIEADWTDSSYLDPVRGWAISSSARPSDWGAFTNGVGFAFQARPAGSRIEHSSFTDGQVELWAYGADCTAGGAATGYAKHPMYYNGLLVNGIGMMNPESPADPYYSRIIEFTNTQSFTYVAGDITKGYNRSNYDTTGLENMTFPFYTYATNQVPYVSGVQRHVVFPHKKYLVIYDQMQTAIPATFQWLWHVLEPTTVVNPTNCSFTYTCTNEYNGSNVTVYVQHIVNPALMTVTNLAGTSYCKYNPFTKENYLGADNDTGPYCNGSIWAYNNAPTNNWHFLTVVYPVKWGDAAPTITRIDDYTVKVETHGISDTISFTPGSSQPSVSLQLQAGPQPPQNLHVVP